jgi:hypothetical protein
MNIFQKYISYGLSVIPCNGKFPTIKWKEYQTTPPGFETENWSGNIAIICGAVSGGLLCIDFDIKNGNKWDEWISIIQDQYPQLLSKLAIESTPSGGYHVVFRTDISIGNKKLAINTGGKDATIETRGEGGYFVCFPSENYEMYYGSFEFIQKLSNEETEILIQACKSEPQKSKSTTNICGLTPFGDYNNRSDIISLLNSHGWSTVFSRGNTTYFRRPGKEGRCISASWNNVPDRFYVFTTSTQFENMHIYKASAVYSILEHQGNFSDAARELYKQGYGERAENKQQKVEKTEKIEKVFLLNVSEIEKKLFKIRDHGYVKGKSTGWKSVDKLYSVIKGQFTVVHGYPSHGKSEFVDSMTLNLALSDGWKFAILSPENYPPEMHFHKLVEKVTMKNFYNCSKEEISKAVKKISDHFFFIDALEEDISLGLILEKADQLIKDKKIDGLVIDPFNEIELSRPKDRSDSDYIGDCLRIIRKFARKNDIHLWICAHPTKINKIKVSKKNEPDKFEYPVPELYDIQGSSHWRNKADNGICIYRNFENNITEIIVQKIKFRYTGKPGRAVLKYNETNGCYYEDPCTNNYYDEF